MPRYDTERRSAPSFRSLQVNIGKAEFETSVHEGSGLFVGPAMACVTSGPLLRLPLHGHQPTTREEHSAYFSKPGLDV